MVLIQGINSGRLSGNINGVRPESWVRTILLSFGLLLYCRGTLANLGRGTLF